MTKHRRHFAGTEKVAILKRHLLDKVPISDLCDELGMYVADEMAACWTPTDTDALTPAFAQHARELVRVTMRLRDELVATSKRMSELGLTPEANERAVEAADERVAAMTEVATGRDEPFVVRRISEQVQSDADLMLRLKRIGIQPGSEVTLATSHDGVRVTCGDYSEGRSTELSRDVATHVFVTRR